MSDPITRLNAPLEGRYRVEREIGEGGMARVYPAEDLRPLSARHQLGTEDYSRKGRLSLSRLTQSRSRYCSLTKRARLVRRFPVVKKICSSIP